EIFHVFDGATHHFSLCFGLRAPGRAGDQSTGFEAFHALSPSLGLQDQFRKRRPKLKVPASQSSSSAKTPISLRPSIQLPPSRRITARGAMPVSLAMASAR